MVSFFFQIAISPLACVATFSEQLYFGRSYFFTLFQSIYFDTTVAFSGQLFLQNSCFFPFFRTVNFSQELFFQNSFFFGANLLQSRHFLRISVKKFFTEITFRNSYFIWRNCSGERYLKKQLIFQSRYFYTVLTFSEKIDFGKS